MSHICTSRSFVVDDVPQFEKICPICCKKNMMTATWVSVICEGCRLEHGPDYTMGYICRKRRKYLGLTRRQMSEQTGYSPKTIKTYEWGQPSEKYFKITEEVVKTLNLK